MPGNLPSRLLPRLLQYAARTPQQHQRHLHACSQLAEAMPAHPSAAAAPPGSFLSWLPGAAKARVAVPLTQPLPGVAIVPPAQPTEQLPATEITVLPNGARIVSESSPGPTGSIGLYVNSGSIYEDATTAGASALLECLAFRSTRHRTTTQLMMEVEALGLTVATNASREQMSYSVDGLKTCMPQAIELLCDSVLCPAFTDEEVLSQKQRLGLLLANPDLQLTLLTEELLRAAYSGPLAQPLIPDPSRPELEHITPEVLHGFVRRNYVAPRMVLAAAGVEHGRLVELARPMLETLPTIPSQEEGGAEPTSQYVSGSVHMPGSFPKCNIILAFEYQGGWRDVKGAVAMTVLTYLLGGGDSFSSGGPGKGMHSRLYTRVLNQYAWTHSCTAFSNTFNESGLVGIQASCDPSQAQRMLDVMCSELEAVSRPVPSVELERAKRASISLIYNALESKTTSAEDIGRQFLTYGYRISGREYVEAVNRVTPHEIAQYVQQLLSSKPSLACYGDGSESISYDNVVHRFSGPLGAMSSRLQGAFRMRA